MFTPVSVVQMLDALAGEDGVQVHGDVSVQVRGASPLNAGPPSATLAFCERDDDTAVARIVGAAARVVVVPSSLLGPLSRAGADKTCIACSAPRRAFVRIVARCWPQDPRAESMAGAHLVDPSAQVADDAFLGAGVTVGAGCRIGAGSLVMPGSHLYAGTRLGARVRVDANAVLGSPGFGFERDGDGRWLRFPQLAGVRVGDDVELGAGVCVDRGALVDTQIGRGTKVDDRVYVAHNVVIGEDCLLMAGCMVCGSCRIDDGAVISPGASVREHVRVGREAHVGMGAVVVSDVAPGTVVAGVPARFLRNGSYWN